MDAARPRERSRGVGARARVHRPRPRRAPPRDSRGALPDS